MKHAVKDMAVIIFSIVLAVFIVDTDIVEKLLSTSENIGIVGSFVAGLLFTSIFTTAPAIIVLGEISQTEPIFIVALVGAIGALCGDMIIFYLFKNHVSDDLNELTRKIKKNPFKTAFRHRNLRWFGVLVGAIIIASPFPDELGIAMMGISKLKTKFFIPISFILNFIGILAIGFAARLIT